MHQQKTFKDNQLISYRILLQNIKKSRTIQNYQLVKSVFLSTNFSSFSISCIRFSLLTYSYYAFNLKKEIGKQKLHFQISRRTFETFTCGNITCILSGIIPGNMHFHVGVYWTRSKCNICELVLRKLDSSYINIENVLHYRRTNAIVIRKVV